MKHLFVPRGPHHYPIVPAMFALTAYCLLIGLGWVFYVWPAMFFRGWARAFTWSPRW